MALTYGTAKIEAEAIASMANELATQLARISQLLEHNSDMAIDWGAGALPPYLSEDGAGNLSDLPYSRQDVANAIGSIDQMRRLLTNQSVSQGDHLSNLNKLARPLG